jgi:hypothetical protein
MENTITTKDVLMTRQHNFIHFSTPYGITREQASELQGQLGYHPGGYGLYSFRTTPELTTWECASSCD